jgi:hypothetical protein
VAFRRRLAMGLAWLDEFYCNLIQRFFCLSALTPNSAWALMPIFPLNKSTKKPVCRSPGNPAIFSSLKRPVAFRPRLATGLALSVIKV